MPGFQDDHMKQPRGENETWAPRLFRAPQLEHKHTYPAHVKEMNMFKRDL